MIKQNRGGRSSIASPASVYQIDFICLEGTCKCGIGLMHSFCTLGEEGLFLVVELELNNLLDTVATENTGHAYADVAFAILAFEQGGARNHLLLVVEDGLYKLGCCCAGAYQALVPRSFVRVAPPTIVSAATFSRVSLLRSSVAGMPRCAA